MGGFNNIIGYGGYNFTKIGQDYSETNRGIITKYFYYKSNPACYYCVLNRRNHSVVEGSEDDKAYQRAYFTAIARERQLTYKITKRISDIVKKIQNDP